MTASGGPSIPVDDWTAGLVEAYRRHLAAEPPQDAGGHPSLALHEQVGDVWAEWKQEERSLRRMIATRLVASVLDGETSAVKGSLHQSWCDFPKCAGPCNCGLLGGVPTANSTAARS